MSDNVDVNSYEFYDPIVHQEDHMKDHIGFRINAGEFEGVSVKMPLNNIRYYPDENDYSFEWNVFGNNHDVPKEKFKTEQFTLLIRDILKHMVEQQMNSLLQQEPLTNVPINLDDYEDRYSQQKSQELMVELFEDIFKEDITNNIVS